MEQISHISLLTNQVIKVTYSYFESPPKIVEHDTTNRCIITCRIVNPFCTKVFGTHTFYEGGKRELNHPPPHVLENGRPYKLQLWQAIRPIYEK